MLSTVVLLVSVALASAGKYEYELIPDLRNFASAKADCASRGGELALPTSKEEEADMLEPVNADKSINWRRTEFSSHKFVWLNIEEDDKNAPLTALTYKNYAKSQPNRASEKCVAAAAGKGGIWSDRPCNGASPYVCQFVAKKYEYTAFSDLVNFKSAQNICKAKGGVLALPENKEEESQILAAVNEDPSVDFSATKFKTHKFFWINVEETRSNKPTVPLVYKNYAKSQPNRATERCVGSAAAKAGIWSDRPCADKSPFVCQFTFVNLQCWRNKIPQQLTRLEGTNPVLDLQNYKKRTEAITKCEKAARDGEYDFFSLGNGGQCWAGHGQDYQTYGQVTRCPENGKGFYGVTNVYELL